ncbi:GGDEF domain-containing protein [Sporosarcina newyorkensis]|uniref:Diguanylate cyclase (GGDEF) domain-containing protein n=1 Tax=Sporosarcina newyorkensis TaxID=759851 RepID=A0A1T4Y0Y3_9BACL|nr:GGDEF domain-containing protein [Sporosarcina newyorkensis]SKA95293.1 diguanylate cyclase (GGDEF) domain-containing protein [Sporosarcina newyorkensis]
MLHEKELATLQNSISHLRSEGKYELVIKTAEELLKKGTQYADPKAILYAHYFSALSNYYVGDLKKVLFHIEAHHENCLSFGAKQDWMRSYYLQYFVSFISNDFEHGQKLLEDVLSIALETENFVYVSMAYSNLSHTLNKTNQFSEALKAAQSAVKYANLYVADRFILSIRGHLYLVESALNMKRSDIAMTSIKCLDQLPEIQKYPQEKAFLTILKGRLYELLGDQKKAFQFYTTVKESDLLLHDNFLLKEIQQKRIEIAEHLFSYDELAIIQKEYIDLLHELESYNWGKAALELKLRLQASSKKTNEHLDYLTGLYNRRYLEETTDRLLAAASHTKESIVCIAFDIDNLKSINDTYGHLAGDEAIKMVAKVCSSLIRRDDILGRFGGDEFVLVMHGISREQAKKKALLIAKKIETIPLDLQTVPENITISIGIGDNLMRDVVSFKDLFHLADLALYRAKQNGKNQIVSFV